MNEFFRPTAYPLITVDPYFSVWSCRDRLTDDTTRHWTGRRSGMFGCIRVDGVWYRFLGRLFSDDYCYSTLPRALKQISVQTEATKTEYVFKYDFIRLKLTFRTPLLMDDLEIMSRPISYIAFEVDYSDGNEHDTEIYFDLCSEACKDDIKSEVIFGVNDKTIYCGRGAENIFSTCGDDKMIDWGYIHLAMKGANYRLLDDEQKKSIFVLPEPVREPKPQKSKEPGITSQPWVISATKSYGKTTSFKDLICVGYDDIYALEYFGKPLKSYWSLNGESFYDVLEKAFAEYETLTERCEKFDNELRQSAETISREYADLVCLAYRQVIAAHKLSKHNDKLLFCSKECFSGGFISTVDITYPSLPMFLFYRPELVEGMLNPIFEYVEGNHGWHYDFAPHDVGFYPKITGQAYRWEGESESYQGTMSHMPIEECGNMLLCTAALCKVRNDFSYAEKHIQSLQTWADYLVRDGYDPDNQLCTDDFAGHLAHNCNLSVKSILGIAAFGYLLQMLFGNDEGYIEKAREMKKQWENAANNGDHYRLAFDKKNTWSLKYNMVWERFFGFGIFEPKIIQTEIEYYKKKFNCYGLPLDSRADYGKTDWQIWVGCLTEDAEFLRQIAKKIHCFVCESEERVPFSDWYETSRPSQLMFQNRTVQGGLFMPLLLRKMG